MEREGNVVSQEIENNNERKIFISGGDNFDPGILVQTQEDLKKNGIKVNVEIKQKLIDQEDLADELKDAEIYVIGGDERIGTEAIEKAEKLKLIIFLGVEYETSFLNEALEKVKERGIEIKNMPGVNTEAVAQLTSGLIFDLSRGITKSAEKVKKGKWEAELGEELEGKTLGIIGLGAVGENVAKKMKNGFDMKVVYWSRHRKEDVERKLGIEYRELNNLLAESDFVSIHSALSPETKHFLNEERLKRMKKGAFLVNAARADLVDKQALKEVLDSGLLNGAAFDGWYKEGNEFEKDPDGLIKHEKLIVTPHEGFKTHQTIIRQSKVASEIIKNFYFGLSSQINIQRHA